MSRACSATSFFTRGSPCPAPEDIWSLGVSSKGTPVLYAPLTETLLSINGGYSPTCYVRERSSRKGNDMQLVPSLQELSLLSCQQTARRSRSGSHNRSWA